MCAPSPESFPQPLERDVESDLVTIPEAVGDRLGGSEYRDLNAIDGMLFHASCEGMAAESHEADRKVFDVGFPSGAVDGDPDRGRHLECQFMKLERGCQADHSLGYAG